MIHEEDEKSEKNMKMVRNMNKSIKKYKKNISQKQQNLKNIMDEMSFYSVESQLERKGNLLATGELFRGLRTSSSVRSKPS